MTKQYEVGTENVKHSTTFSVSRFIFVLLPLLTLLTLLSSTNSSATASISQSYSSEEKLSLGSIVSLKNNTTDQVELATISNVDGLLGVVIDASNSILSLSGGGTNQVQVGTNGTLQVLVSNINGDIVQGDHITASPISGVGMRATDNVRIVGIAQGQLSANNGTKQTYKDSAGETHDIILGQVPILVNVSYYFKEPDKTLIPSALQNIANALAGKSVETLPIIISAAIFIIMLIIVVSIIFSMIKSSIISVGRNPMSQSAIYRDLIQLSTLVLAILTVGMISIYLILTRM